MCIFDIKDTMINEMKKIESILSRLEIWLGYNRLQEGENQHTKQEKKTEKRRHPSAPLYKPNKQGAHKKNRIEKLIYLFCISFESFVLVYNPRHPFSAIRFVFWHWFLDYIRSIGFFHIDKMLNTKQLECVLREEKKNETSKRETNMWDFR